MNRPFRPHLESAPAAYVVGQNQAEARHPGGNVVKQRSEARAPLHAQPAFPSVLKYL